MQKIMFNERYGLNDAVLEGYKKNTRRPEFSAEEQQVLNEADDVYMDGDDVVAHFDSAEDVRFGTRYKVGEIVAVAQSYERIYEELWPIDKYEARHYAALSEKPGWRNKMFTKADLMPHRIRITGKRAERLQDISDADCLKEGIRYVPKINKFYFGNMLRDEGFYFDNHRQAFAALIDKVSRRGTWASNPWVVAYEYELIK